MPGQVNNKKFSLSIFFTDSSEKNYAEIFQEVAVVRILTTVSLH